MALLLNIDTATEHAGVCVSRDDQVIAMEQNADQKTHASFLQSAIQKMMQKIHVPLAALDAIAVTAGPGSYTGLRVALASAKGLCYALDKPLITVSTLEVMAYASIEFTKSFYKDADSFWYCPMIDARRAEVFMAVYNSRLNYIQPPAAIILTDVDTLSFCDNHKVIFSGNGHLKLTNMKLSNNAILVQVQHNVAQLSKLALTRYNQKKYADPAYSEPEYLKEFYSKPLEY